MMLAEAFASVLMATILPFIFLRSRTTLERLPIASARLPPDFCWMRDDDGEEIRLGDRHALVELADAVAERQPERLRLDDGAELGPHRLLRLVGDDAQAIAERQARAHAAHDDVHGVRQLVEKPVDAALLEVGEDPARQAERSRRTGRALSPTALPVTRNRSSARTTPASALTIMKRLRVQAQPRLGDALLQAHLVAGLLARLDAP